MDKQEIERKKWNFDCDISWIDASKKLCAISFDDGPVFRDEDGSSKAERIHKALTEQGMHATFFYWANTLTEETEKEILSAQEQGFEIGNHTKTHPDLTKLSEEEIRQEVVFMDEALQRLTGLKQFLVRPPYLLVDQKVKDVIQVPLIRCGLDTRDWAKATAEEMIQTIKDAVEGDYLEGKIVLMHECFEESAKAMQVIAPYLKEHGYLNVNISEMFRFYDTQMESGTEYSACK